jgi:hypothetical protein
MSAVSRRSRVSSRFALITQNWALRQYHGGCVSKYRHALFFARILFS